MAIAKRLFAGAALQTTLSSSISNADTTIAIVSDTGWPSGTEEFFVVIDPDQANEEKLLVTRSTTTLTAASTAKRGLDGTVAAAHSAGAVIYPCVTATDLDEANGFVSTLTTKGDLLVQGSSDVGRLPVGSNNQMLVADSAQSLGVKWAAPPDLGDLGDVNLSGLSDGDTIQYDSSSGDWLPASSAGSAQVPVGTILETLRDSAPTGYLLCQGQTLTGADVAYPLLWAALGATFKSGSNIVLPDLRGRVNIGAGTGAGLTARTLGATGGTETHTLTTAEMPVHTHTQNAHTHTQNAHTHTQNAHGHLGSTSFLGEHTHNSKDFPLEPSPGTFAAGTNKRGRESGSVNQATSFAGDHSHTVNIVNTTATNQNATATNQNATATNNNAGSGGAHQNMQPFVVVNKMIRVA
jgi:microcystin-dependent protein